MHSNQSRQQPADSKQFSSSTMTGPACADRDLSTSNLTQMTKQLTTASLKSPSVVTFSADFGTPVSIFHHLIQLSKNGFLFESTEGDGRLARFSFLGVDPLFTVSIKNGQAVISRDGRDETQSVENPVSFLEEILARNTRELENSGASAEKSQHCGGVSLGELPFFGGLVGYMGYAGAGYIEKIERQAQDPFGVPDAYYGFYDAIVAFDHQYRRISVVSHRGESHAYQLMKQTMSRSGLVPLRLEPTALTEEELFDGVSGPFDQAAYEKSVKQAKQFIHEGQAFQIVVAQRFSMESNSDPIDIYRMLQATNPSPYAYYLKCPDFEYIGSSPETFVRCREGQVMLRAIAGTRPRGITVEQDEQLAVELRANEKEMAEHRMLVDLGRNDLGRVCTPGSIKLGELAYFNAIHARNASGNRNLRTTGAR